MLQNKTDNLEKGKKLTLQLTEQNNVKEQNGQGLGTKQIMLRKKTDNVMEENNVTEEYEQCYGRIRTMLGKNTDNVRNRTNSVKDEKMQDRQQKVGMSTEGHREGSTSVYTRPQHAGLQLL